jgi:UDP-N-acetyl-D-galactosamine dehydrogenase
MGKYVAGEVVRLLINTGQSVKNLQILILGLAFKENCPDIRNTKVVDIVQGFMQYNLHVDNADSHENTEEARYECGLDVINIVFKKNTLLLFGP